MLLQSKYILLKYQNSLRINANVVVYKKLQNKIAIIFNFSIKTADKYKLCSLHLTAIFYIRGCGLYFNNLSTKLSFVYIYSSFLF